MCSTNPHPSTVAADDSDESGDWRHEAIHGGSLKLVDLDTGSNGWASPPGDLFSLRSSSYFTKKTKSPSGPYLLRPAGVDWLRSHSKLDHVLSRPDNRVLNALRKQQQQGEAHPQQQLGRKQQQQGEAYQQQQQGEAHPQQQQGRKQQQEGESHQQQQQGEAHPHQQQQGRKQQQQGEEHQQHQQQGRKQQQQQGEEQHIKITESHTVIKTKTFILAVNLQVPGRDHHSAVFYFATDDPIPAGSLLYRFIHGDDAFRNQRFKLVNRIVKGPWIVKAAVGNHSACLLGKALTCRYHSGPNYLEIDVDISSSKIATAILHLALGCVTAVTIDMGFVVEAQEEEELPERLLGAVRVCQMEMTSATFVESVSKVPVTAGGHGKRVQASEMCE